MASWTRLDPTCVDLTNFDLSQIDQVAGAISNRAVDLAKDAAYVTVGLGLLSYQRIQVRRRELERTLRR
jgi:hypothetical protein